MARSVRDRHGAGRTGGRRWRVVALVGIDGSGKTTQAHRLAGRLTGAGHPARYWRNAGGRRFFGRLARRVGRHDAQSLLGRHGMLLAESLLRWLAIARALAVSGCTGRIAVMDRYAACQYASVRAHAVPGWEPAARLFYRMFPAPDLTILLAVDPAEAYRRIELRGTDQESLAFLAAAAVAYRSLPEYAGFAVVDANGPVAEVGRAIDELLSGWLRGDGRTGGARPGDTGRPGGSPGVGGGGRSDAVPGDPAAHRRHGGQPVPVAG